MPAWGKEVLVFEHAFRDYAKDQTTTGPQDQRSHVSNGPVSVSQWF